ncbi:esterase-like activity of phytase family protein [Synechococcus sp. PCC 7336]|uniref:esterase-like activity of phytase family protein n=1 Tax=Synechococcus sp. PCC 7336 TaxID=195250 RepID=UPI0003700C0C|nr:esterase-like activity of phytase family protein [Synechococcus sp. PCC 7336]
MPRSKLIGFTSLPADTFAEGPQSGADNGSGKPISANGRTGPFDGQPIQGFSGVQFFPAEAGSFLFLSDNGFGAQINSADYLLRLYRVAPSFAGIEGGDGGVEVQSFIQLSDPDHLIPFDIVNEDTEDRLLTGADFDIESFIIANDGSFWIGEEFGPFLLHFDSSGKLIDAPIPTPNISALGMADDFVPNLPQSRGYEGLAFSPDRTTAYPLLEGTVEGDRAGALRIYEFDLMAGKFADELAGFYQLADPSHAIGDFTPINEDEFLVIERDGLQGAAAEFKKIFKIDLSEVDDNGFVAKEELVDLLNLDDPNDLNGDGSTRFDFPFVTIEAVLVLDKNTILVANDNNYPFSVGRGPDIDDTEIIMLELETPLNLDPRLGTDGEIPLTVRGNNGADEIIANPESTLLMLVVAATSIYWKAILATMN